MEDSSVLLVCVCQVYCARCVGSRNHTVRDTPAGVALTCVRCGLVSEIPMQEPANATQEN